MPPELLEPPRHAHPGRAAVDDKERDAADAGVGVGLHGEGDEVARRAVGDERLGAVDNILVAVPARRGAQRADVGARVGLGDGEGAHEAAGHRRREVAALEVVGAPAEDVLGGHELLHRDRRAKTAEQRARQLLEEHDRKKQVAAGAAVLGRREDAEEPQLAEAREHVTRDPAQLLPGVGVWCDLGLEEAAHRGAKRRVLCREVDRAHRAPSCGSA